MLSVAIENRANLETVKALVSAGAVVGLPSVNERPYDTEQLLALMKNTSHAIGLALSYAANEVEPKRVELKYITARYMLAAAFRENPGAALCAAVAVAEGMRQHADRTYVENVEFATYLRSEADEVGSSVGALITSLPEFERGLLLRSGAHAPSLALLAHIPMLVTPCPLAAQTTCSANRRHFCVSRRHSARACQLRRAGVQQCTRGDSNVRSNRSCRQQLSTGCIVDKGV